MCDMYDYEQPKNKLNLYIFYYIVKLLFIIEPSCVMPESPTYEAHTVLATSDVYSGTTNVMDSFALWGSLFLIESRFSPWNVLCEGAIMSSSSMAYSGAI